VGSQQRSKGDSASLCLADATEREATMRAVVPQRYGPPDVLESADVDLPLVGIEDVLIRVRACSVHPRRLLPHGRRPVCHAAGVRTSLALSDLLGAGQVTPAIDRTFSLSEAADAFRHVGAGHTRGKAVVTF
jgi:NADPH:quinone reductase-like Zn-dependent oxidoreductase